MLKFLPRQNRRNICICKYACEKNVRLKPTTYACKFNLKMACRICYESGEGLHSVCKCDGTIKYVHKECIVKWQKISKATHCELCKAKYRIPWPVTPERGQGINCPCLLWVLFGMLIAYMHAVLLYEQSHDHPYDITSSILSALFIIGIYSVFFWLNKFIPDIYIKIALVIWPISFFVISYLFQSSSGNFGVNVWLTYGISLSCFICWGLLFSLENKWCCTRGGE